jgi:hypothetical protein
MDEARSSVVACVDRRAVTTAADTDAPAPKQVGYRPHRLVDVPEEQR